jgi:hypothetical protein
MRRALYVLALLSFTSCSDDTTPAPGKDIGVNKDKPIQEAGSLDLGAKAEGTAPVEGGIAHEAAAKDSASSSGFASQVQPIFTQLCTSCHSGSSPKANLDLSSGKAYGQLVGVPSTVCSSLNRVQAGSTANSYLVHKVEGSGSCFTGNKMPPSGGMSSTQLTTIKSWISAGAPNN